MNRPSFRKAVVFVGLATALYLVTPIIVALSFVAVENYTNRLIDSLHDNEIESEVDAMLWAYRKILSDINVFPDEFIAGHADLVKGVRKVYSYRFLQIDIHVGYDEKNRATIVYDD